VESQPRLKREYFEKVLLLRPADVEARAGLDRLTEKYGSGVLASDNEVEMLHCTWHPERETLLRCNRCDRPMCTECAVQHPVGLRCKECIKETRSPLYKVSGGLPWRPRRPGGGPVAFGDDLRHVPGWLDPGLPGAERVRSGQAVAGRPGASGAACRWGVTLSGLRWCCGCAGRWTAFGRGGA
jgi:hypothetical protein